MRFEYGKARWRGFELDVGMTRVRQGDVEILGMVAQVPLATHAVNLLVTGFAGDEAQLRTIFDGVLASLQGESNWLSDDERSERLGRVVGFALGMTIVIAALVWRVRRRRRS